MTDLTAWVALGLSVLLVTETVAITIFVRLKGAKGALPTSSSTTERLAILVVGVLAGTVAAAYLAGWWS